MCEKINDVGYPSLYNPISGGLTKAIFAKGQTDLCGGLTICRTYGFLLRSGAVRSPNWTSSPVEADAVTLQPFATSEVSLITVMAQIERDVFGILCDWRNGPAERMGDTGLIEGLRAA